MNYYKCRITVVKKELYRDIANEFLKEPEKIMVCDKVEENREYVVINPYYPPEGFCPSAWADIRPYLLVAAAGGRSDSMKENNVMLAICSDPFRPVVFKIEIVE